MSVRDQLGIVVAALALGAGCDSLLGAPCASGYTLQHGTCVPADPDLEPDIDPTPDRLVAELLPIDESGPVCQGVDLSRDPDNCGACGHVCASGICTTGHCVGDPWGHVIAIGHDYSAHHAVARRVLGNALTLSLTPQVRVAWWAEGIDPSWEHVPAVDAALAERGRSWREVSFPSESTPKAFEAIDVVVIPPLRGDGDVIELAATRWAEPLDRFARRGGVIVVLEGRDGQSYRFARGAGLFESAAPVDVTGATTVVVDPTDALALAVLTPYLAEPTTVAFPGADGAVVTTTDGAPIALHFVR